MCNGKCGWGCLVSILMKILVVVGGLNWGLIGVGMLMNNDLNVVHMVFGSLPNVEAIVYLLVGIAALMKLFGYCRCKKCKETCANCCSVSGNVGENTQG